YPCSFQCLHRVLPSMPLFFPCSPAHRDLHSFPTRRSSDLQGLHHVAQISKYIIFPLWSSRILVMNSFVGVSFVNFNNVFSLGCRDRKSTRLNSSHVTISYAVFCLKKKMFTRNSVRTAQSVK